MHPNFYEVVDTLKAYRIPFTGLNEGEHQFEFRLDGAFFEEFGNEDLSTVQASVQLNLNKTSSIMEIDYTFEGTYATACDRCLGDLEIPLSGAQAFVAKLDGDVNDDDIICLRDNDTEVDMSAYFYESIVLSIPAKLVHDEKDCDPEVISRLDTYSRGDSEESDPRWEALKKLK